MLLFVCQSQHLRKTTHIGTVEDAVIISIQGSCLFDRYEYATGSANNKEVVCFYSGIEGMRYNNDDAYNMEVTKKACSYAYEIYKEIVEDIKRG